MLLQETHSNDASPPLKYRIAGFTRISKVHRKKYGLMTYAKDPITTMESDATLSKNNIHRSTKTIGTLNFGNIYKPSTSPLPQYIII